MGLDIVELVIAIEEHFGIELPDVEFSTVLTAGDLHALVLSKLGRGHDPAAAWETICGLMVRQLGLRREEITPEARIVEDLGIE